MRPFALMPVTTSPNAVVPVSTYQLVLPTVDKKPSLFNRLGNFTGKIFSFFKKPQTKISALIGYWAVETILFTAIMLAATSSFVFFSALFLYLYGTYAIFAAVNALAK